MASITKRKDGLWQGSVYVKNIDGTTIRKTVYGKTKKEVQQKLAELQEQSIKPITLNQWINVWLKNYAPFIFKPTTLDSYKRFIKNHIQPALGNMYLSDIKPIHIQHLIAQKSKSGRADNSSGGLSKRSLKYIHQILNNLFNQAIKEGFIFENPAHFVKVSYDYKTVENILSNSQLQKFLETAKTSRYYLIYLLELSTGMRRGEILGLKWKDIDFNKSTITIKREVVLVKGKPVVQESVKSKSSFRTLIIPQDILNTLKNLPKTSEFIFVTSNNTIINPSNLRRDFKKIIKKAGLPSNIRFHDLRHTYATYLLEAGVNIKFIQQELGHSNPAFTLQRYSHVTFDYQSEVINIKNSLINITRNNDLT